MSFFKRLFGGGATVEPEDAKPAKQIEHKGFTISATPYKSEGQYQTCGMITKAVGGETKEHQFIRADRFPSVEDADSHSIRKGMQIIDEQGEAIFRQA